jgi:hypothetical protein
METSTRIIDYHLKECIEGQNSKITLSGRTQRGCRKMKRGWSKMKNKQLQ